MRINSAKNAYLLLGNQTTAEIHYEKLDPQIINDFMEFPIYHFWAN